MKVDQIYCTHKYHCDYPRRDRMIIDKCPITEGQKADIRKGITVFTAKNHYYNEYEPIVYDDIIGE